MSQSPRHTNSLIHESSPYLLQHAHNPVEWHAWGEEALEKAKRENKLILVSIGYAACHWCHVMEHESFEDEAVAEVMNQHFVNIKIDREERPDIDQIYMDAVQIMTGQGGWPLNCVALPDGRPIWGGTYFRKSQWIDILEQLSVLWKRDPDKAYGYAERMLEAISKMDSLVPIAEHKPFSIEFLESILKPWKTNFDLEEGGYNRAPKFPMPSNWLFFLREGHFSGDSMINSAVQITLKKMAWGGIYDQLGGGFARYSVDGLWKVPHFEKMTYDNGQLISLYSEAYQKSPDPLYARIVAETFSYMQREMLSPDGGWYSSLDADSEGVEGKFYVWKKSEIDALLGNDSGWFCDYYRVTAAGNWEHGNNILLMGESPAEFASKRGLSEESLLQKLEAAKAILMEERDTRIRPGLDDKVLTSWNALMIKGCVDAFRAFGDQSYLDSALRTANFIEDHLQNGAGLFRNYKSGKASINAFLDDYALLAEAYLALHQVTFEVKWLHRSKALVEYAFSHFYNKKAQLFYYTSDLDPALITRKMELLDNVIPGSNSVMANVLFDLGHILEDARFLETSENMLQNMQKDMSRYGGSYSHWAILMEKHIRPFFEVVVTGPNAKAVASEIDQAYFPNKILAASVLEEDQYSPLFAGRFQDQATQVFVCEGSACQLPVSSAADAIALLHKLSK